jgi:triacylglycerol lipase
MPTLTPQQAAQIAEGVYHIQNSGVVAATQARTGANLKEGVSGRFAVADESRVKGKSGIRTWWPITGFGFVATGIGLFEGEAIIALRGTAGAHDWMTDANASAVGGVHTGFATTWASIKPQVDQFFRGRRFETIHCIGHSLGGALATLAALHCAESGYGAPELYTFGSPRVGFASVAQRVTAAIGAARIHRVAHSADPVPMIPLWPFVHVPTTSEVIVLDPGGWLPINPTAHYMSTSYLNAMAGIQSWGNLTRVSPAASQRHVEQWIADVGSGKIAAQQLSERDLYMLAQSVNYASERMGEARTAVLGAASYGVASGLDFLSESELRYERAKLQATQRMMQGGEVAARKAGEVAVAAGRAMADAKRAEMEIEAERNRQLMAAAKAIYVYTRQQAQWAGQEAKQGAKAAIDAHAKAMNLLDQHVYQPIGRMAVQAMSAAK